jgi:hypothetical protein
MLADVVHLFEQRPLPANDLLTAKFDSVANSGDLLA